MAGSGGTQITRFFRDADLRNRITIHGLFCSGYAPSYATLGAHDLYFHTHVLRCTVRVTSDRHACPHAPEVLNDQH